MPELFEAQAARTPRATAVVCGSTRLTFAEVNARANLLAHRLRVQGAGAERSVALALPRSAESVVAMLAVLKTGAAYLQVDLEYPPERIEHMLRDAAPVAVVTDTATAVAHGFGELPAVFADGIETPSGPVADLKCRVLPDSAAYVIHTSGSTGRPKGVVTPHSALSNLYAFHRAGLIARTEAAAGRRLRSAVTASLSFDTSWEALFWMLAGHELHVIRDDVRRDAAALTAYVKAAGIDVLDVTPLTRSTCSTRACCPDHVRRWCCCSAGKPPVSRCGPASGRRPAHSVTTSTAPRNAPWMRCGGMPRTARTR
ncbi:AMP-binding protein [Streptomyces sp. M10(2022)]